MKLLKSQIQNLAIMLQEEKQKQIDAKKAELSKDKKIISEANKIAKGCRVIPKTNSQRFEMITPKYWVNHLVLNKIKEKRPYRPHIERYLLMNIDAAESIPKLITAARKEFKINPPTN